MAELEELYSFMDNGFYKPFECIPRQKVAIIVPYRDREMGLLTFLNNVIPRVSRQNLEFGIYLIEQVFMHNTDWGEERTLILCVAWNAKLTHIQ